jgi:hypothetical protein
VSGPIHLGPVTDPVAALTAVAAAMERLGVVAEQRAGFLVTVARALREHHPGARLILTGGGASLRATIGGAGGPDPDRTAPVAGREGGSRGRSPGRRAVWTPSPTVCSPRCCATAPARTTRAC